MDKVNDLIAALIVALQEMQQGISKTKADIEAANEKLSVALSELNSRKELLDAREVEIKKVEDVIAAGNEAREMLKAAREVEAANRDTRERFDVYVAKAQSEIGAKLTVVEQREKSLANEFAALAKKEQEFLEKQKDMIARIISKLEVK